MSYNLKRERRIRENLRENLMKVFPDSNAYQIAAFEIMEGVRKAGFYSVNAHDIERRFQIPLDGVIGRLLTGRYVARDRSTEPYQLLTGEHFSTLYGLLPVQINIGNAERIPA